MSALYRKRFALPSLILALNATGCDDRPPTAPMDAAIPDIHLEALQQAEALKHSLDEHDREQRRLDALLGRDQTPAQ